MALGNLGPHLTFDEVGDHLLDERYMSSNVSLYCAFERADMDKNRSAFNQLMQGRRFKPLLHHMAVTKSLGMQWNYFLNDIFVDSNNVEYHVCSLCLHLAPYKCACRNIFYCSIECQRAHWSSHKKVCSTRTHNWRRVGATSIPPAAISLVTVRSSSNIG